MEPSAGPLTVAYIFCGNGSRIKALIISAVFGAVALIPSQVVDLPLEQPRRMSGHFLPAAHRLSSLSLLSWLRTSAPPRR